MRYPWQTKQWQQFWQSVQAGRLPHALLLSGMTGTGKTAFAMHAAQALLCQSVNSEGDPCDQCHACRLVKTSAHPNVYQVTPEEGHAIKVDQIRALAEFIQQSSLQGEYRIAVIYPAHSMNVSAANALLKTLEEPASGAILILVTDQANHLPATVRSRCQRILFPRPDQDQSLAWLRSQPDVDYTQAEQSLRLAHGAPLAALALGTDEIMPLRNEIFQALHQLTEKRTDPLTLSAKWQKVDPVMWLNLVSGWITDIVRLQLHADHQQLLNQDFTAQLTTASQKIPLTNNMNILNRLLAARSEMSHGVNFNKQLLMESLMIRWLEPQT